MRVALWSEDAEKSVLGSMILSRVAIDEAMDSVSYADFYRPGHQILFTHIERLAMRGVEADFVTLRNSLSESGHLEKCGGLDYLIQIAEFVPSAANVRHYARIVRDKAFLRRLQDVGAGISGLATDEKLALDEKLSRAEDLIAQLTGSVTSAERKVVDLAEVLRQIDQSITDQHDEGALTGSIIPQYPSKFAALRDIIGGFEQGCVYTIGARSSMGKTSYFIDEACHLAALGHPVLFISREMTPKKLTMRFLSKLSKVPMNVVKKGLFNETEYRAWADAMESMYSLPVRFMTHTRATVADIRREARAMHRDFGRMPVICDDYIQMALNGVQNMHMAISQMMTDYKTLAKDLETPVLLLSQLSRASESRGEARRPALMDLKESGSIEENSDAVILIYREEYYEARKTGRRELPESEAEFIVAKNREGGLGVARLRFRPAFTEFVG